MVRVKKKEKKKEASQKIWDKSCGAEKFSLRKQMNLNVLQTQIHSCFYAQANDNYGWPSLTTTASGWVT